MSLTFIHTADWHLGRAYHGIGPNAVHSRTWRFDAVRKVYELAVQENAAFILVAGDVFQTGTPPKPVVDEAVALLRDAPVPTIVIPGNHDPLVEGSVWRRHDFFEKLQGIANITLALATDPIKLASAGAVVFPCPVTSKRSPEDVTLTIPKGTRGGSEFRIGLAHGIWQGYDGQEHYENFVDARRADLSGLDYLALGDLHSYTLPEYPSAKARSYYSGTIECTACDEQRPGHALAVRIESPGADPMVVAKRVGRVLPVQLPDMVLTASDGFNELRHQVGSITDPADVLLSGTVSGSLNHQQWHQFQQWMNALPNKFLGVSLDTLHVFLEPSEADFDGLGLDESQRRVLTLLRDPASATAIMDDPVFSALAADADVRREAVSMFYTLLRGGGLS